MAFDGYHYKADDGEEFWDAEDLITHLYPDITDCDEFMDWLDSRFTCAQDLFAYVYWNLVEMCELMDEFYSYIEDEWSSDGDDIAERNGLTRIEDTEDGEAEE